MRTLVFAFSIAWLSVASGKSHGGEVALPGTSAAIEWTRQPNVLLIYTDDQGSIDLNCYGSKDLATPNLDRLASRGVRFTQMYAPSAICSASRAGLMTGRFPPRAGVPGNVSSMKGNAGMPPTEVTIAEMLKSAGYATAHIGKWHLGYTPETMPNGQGYDYSFGHMGGCIDNYSHFFYWQLGPQWAVREGDWKLLGNPRDTSGKATITTKDKPFLVNLAEDVTEMKNQAEDHAEVVERLMKLRSEYIRDITTP